MEKVYTVKTYDRGTEQRATVDFSTWESVKQYIEIYAKLNFEITLEVRERMAGE